MHEIDSFENYLRGGGVRREGADPSKAKGLIRMAVSDMDRVKEEEISKESSSYVFKNAYDVIRTSITAVMALEGYNPHSHKGVIAYARDRLFLSEPKVLKLNKFRRLRNNVQYRAERADVQEAKEIVGFMEEIVPEMESNIEQNT